MGPSEIVRAAVRVVAVAIGGVILKVIKELLPITVASS